MVNFPVEDTMQTVLQTLLKDVAKERGLSARELGAEIGVSHTTLLRAMRGDVVDVDTLVLIADYLKVRPSTLLDGFGKTDHTAVAMSALIQAEPGLAKVFEEATREIEAGRAEPEIIEDIVSYASYKLGLSGGQHGRKAKK
jgi:transcriptional regulator with XRE-family HTH domain